MERALILTFFVAMAFPVVAAETLTDTQSKLAAFFAKEEGREEVEQLDIDFATCVTDHARKREVRKLVRFLEADDVEGFNQLYNKVEEQRELLGVCIRSVIFSSISDS